MSGMAKKLTGAAVVAPARTISAAVVRSAGSPPNAPSAATVTAPVARACKIVKSSSVARGADRR